MDYENDNNSGYVSPVPVPPAQPMPVKKRRSAWHVVLIVLFSLSVLANIIMFTLLIIVSMAAALAGSGQGIYTESVLQAGQRTNKIAVIRIDGIITGATSEDVARQLKTAAKDDKVMAVILRVNSPGGGVTASDEIYHEVVKFQKQTQKPVVSFMAGLAASGGYYASAGCEKIIAEPTTITGSIGVIMGHFELQELLQEKLGINPVIIKSGPKKDWPTTFEPVTEEQRQYLQDRLIQPAYERFVEIIADGRVDLDIDSVRRLADGSIYHANEALVEKLIDRIGYLEDAIKLTEELTGMRDSQVIEYKKPFSFSDILYSRSPGMLNIGRDALYEFVTPQLMYLWAVGE